MVTLLQLTLFLEDTSLDQFEGQKYGTLLLQCGRVRRHRARCDTSNVCMVSSARHVEHRPCLTWPKHLSSRQHLSVAPGASVPLTVTKVAHTHRCDDSQVWEVAAPCTGVVAEKHITRMEVSS